MRDDELYKLLGGTPCLMSNHWCRTHDYKGNESNLCDFALAMVKYARKGMGLRLHKWKEIK